VGWVGGWVGWVGGVVWGGGVCGGEGGPVGCAGPMPDVRVRKTFSALAAPYSWGKFFLRRLRRRIFGKLEEGGEEGSPSVIRKLERSSDFVSTFLGRS